MLPRFVIYTNVYDWRNYIFALFFRILIDPVWVLELGVFVELLVKKNWLMFRAFSLALYALGGYSCKANGLQNSFWKGAADMILTSHYGSGHMAEPLLFYWKQQEQRETENCIITM